MHHYISARIILEEERDCLITQCFQNQAEITKLKTKERLTKKGTKFSIVSIIFMCT